MTDRLTKAGRARFTAVAEAYVADHSVPGVAALMACGEDLHVEALGSLTTGGPAVTRDSLFRIASTTKPITGAATLALAGEGLLDLEEPVDRLLPVLASPRVLRRMDGPLSETVEANRPITVRDLLTFTFGFGMVMEMFMAAEPWPVVAAAGDLHLATLGPPSPDEAPEPDEWIARLGSLPLLAQPGERWLYNTGAMVLGVLLSRAAEMPFSDVLRTRIFEPLGMRDTAFWTAETGRLATAYQPSEGGFEVWDAPSGQWSRPPAFSDGAAGLLSTVDDLLAFGRMFLTGGSGVLSPEAVRQMTTDQLTQAQRTTGQAFLDGRSWSLCQSVAVEGPHVGSFGWDGGLGTSWLVDPSHDLVIIVLTQRLFENAGPHPIHAELQAVAYSALP